MPFGRPHQVSHPRCFPALTVDGAESPIELILSVLPTGAGERHVVATLRSVAGQIDLERHGQVVDRLLGVLALGPDDARTQLVEVVADSLDWDAGALWEQGPDGVGRDSTSVFSSRPPRRQPSPSVPGRRFRHSDLALAEELAGHAAAVIDTARRHDREHNVAHALQRSLLPDRIATVTYLWLAPASGELRRRRRPPRRPAAMTD